MITDISIDSLSKASFQELIDYSVSIGIGPKSFECSFLSLQKILEEQGCGKPEECVGYATAMANYLRTIDLIAKYIDQDNIAVKTDPLSLHQVSSKSPKKTYPQYVLETADQEQSELIREYIEQKMSERNTLELLCDINSEIKGSPANISNILEKYMMADELNECQEKLSEIYNMGIRQKMYEYFGNTRGMEFLIKYTYGLPKEKHHIIAIGDSITLGSLVDEFTQRSIDSGLDNVCVIGDTDKYMTYPMILENMIKIAYRQPLKLIQMPKGKSRTTACFPTTKLLNWGDYGANSFEIKKKYERQLRDEIDEINPLYSIILCGTNDIGTYEFFHKGFFDEEEIYPDIISNIEEMVCLSIDNEIIPVVCKLTPTGDAEYNERRIMEFNRRLEAKCSEWEVYLIDTYEPLLEKPIIDSLTGDITNQNKLNTLADEFSVGDGVHLNQGGNLVLADTVFWEIFPHLHNHYAELEFKKTHRIKRWWEYMMKHRPDESITKTTMFEFKRENR